MRSLTQATRAAVNAQETSEVFLLLLALSHPTMTTMYFVNNTVDIISNAQTYRAFPFDVQIPDDSDDPVSRVHLSINNVNREIVFAVRSIATPAVFTLSMIRAAEPNVMIAGPFVCTLRNVTYNAQTVEGDLAPYEDILNEPFPVGIFSPGLFPGLFQ